MGGTARTKTELQAFFCSGGSDLHSISTIESELEDLIETFFGTWTDYYATSTVTGWSSFTEELIHYKVAGNIVFVSFALDGTSNATSVSFTLPETVATVSAIQVMIQVKDNGNYAVGMLTVAHGGTTVNIYTDESASSWTNSGAKGAFGQFWYEKA